MLQLSDCKEQIHSCSKCGLCQSVCPIYKITGNDCSVSRGMFVMLYGLLKGKIKISKQLNKYLDLCLKCGACSRFCPSDIDAVKIITLAKAEFFKNNIFEKFVSLFQKYFIFSAVLKILNIFSPKLKSKTFERKVIYFGGCGSKILGNASVVKIMNDCGIEVCTPDFNCCGIPFLMRGDLDTYRDFREKITKKINETGVYEVVTTCASCEQMLKSYNLENVKIKNIFEYIKENKPKLELKRRMTVSFHKPCNIDNYEDVRYILENTKNLEYIEAENFDSCCGLNGVTKFSQYDTMLQIFRNKRKTFIKTGAKYVLTSCMGCQAGLSLFSFGKYKVEDFTRFLSENIL